MATDKQSTISRLLASAGFGADLAPPAPAASQPAAPAAGDPAATVPEGEAVEAITQARAAGRTEGLEAGATAERARWNAVLTSPEGKANASLAVFMLGATPAAAEAITAQLKDAPAAPAAAAPAPAGDKPDAAAAAAAAAGADRAIAPRVPVGANAGALTAHQEGDGPGEEEEKVDGKKFWGELGGGGNSLEMSARVAKERSATHALGTAASRG